MHQCGMHHSDAQRNVKETREREGAGYAHAPLALPYLLPTDSQIAALPQSRETSPRNINPVTPPVFVTGTRNT